MRNGSKQERRRFALWARAAPHFRLRSTSAKTSSTHDRCTPYRFEHLFAMKRPHIHVRSKRGIRRIKQNNCSFIISFLKIFVKLQSKESKMKRIEEEKT